MAVDLSQRNYEDLVREGVLAARSGRKALARRLLLQATRTRPTDARPWVWLSETTEDPLERQQYLEKAIAADPSNATARRGLAILTGQLQPDQVLPEGAGVEPQRPEAPADARGDSFACPQCGGRMGFRPQEHQLACEFCGFTRDTGQEIVADQAEQTLDLVLPTSRGHRWAEADHHLTCDACGAVTLLDVGQRTHQCAYCGSHQLVESKEALELVAPQAIGLMQLDEAGARRAVEDWLKAGLYAPDDLARQASRLELRAAYYPFWTFDGTLEAPWTCEVNEGTGDKPRWVPRRGTEFVFFDDVLIPGLSALSLGELEQILPFPLKEVISFQEDQVAGWPALTYDRAMADASLLARQKVVRDLRKSIHRRVAPGEEKRNLQVGGGKWSGQTFKHVLLPLWVGTYRYQGETYRVLVNGQTGAVGGQKPRDRLKVALVWTTIGIAIIVVGILLVMLWALYGDAITALLNEVFFSLAGP